MRGVWALDSRRTGEILACRGAAVALASRETHGAATRLKFAAPAD
jgi:hypothetical protein